ncbi:cytochrome c biogenesis protein CcmF [Citricoccus zhacaiensis]|uniref:Cytochrome c biogenesis protein CcmF n=1 Tax=Citricoccus zhacaiensis TaxID=489142 RepID=A0ABQ2LS60_9MICC|nr:cytochrome c-type biogenesis CcmF C-terminal domain-containing protein [Citricoccus zhacaiensis]GGO42472.1 cytochrome c biogenesis protein CcmF [Citricoccus zhacaiensis]
MTVLGTVLLILVLAASLTGAIVWAAAARAEAVRVAGPSTTGAGRGRQLAKVGQWMTGLALAAAVAAVALVEVALVSHDTRLNFVAMVSGPELPVYYRITALWSALEGSLLLWLLVLAVVSALAVRDAADTSQRSRGVVGSVLSLTTVAFAIVALMASPFTVDDGAVSARPSPLLQDHVAMGVHPPLLYAGFLGLAVPYAVALGGLVTRQMDAAWAARLRRWTLVSWILLTAGIVLGAWWSYAVLGWGGYWAWDPVENASLLPWLTATAVLHTVAPRARVGAWRLWAAGLAGASFVLVLLATFLTRSGFVESIHAFTTSPLGPALLVIVVAALVPWAVLVHRRRRELGDTSTPSLVSRSTALRVNRTLLVLVTLVVLVGTTLPSILLATTGERLSVGPPWYHRTLAPLALLLLVMMVLGPWLPVRTGTWRSTARRMRLPALAGLTCLGAVALIFSEVWLAVSAGLAAFAVASLAMVASDRRRRDRLAVGAWVAHTGIAVAAVAVLGGGLGTVTQESVPVGGTVTAGETTVTVIGLDGRDEGRRSVAAAQVALGQGQEFVTVVEPELRWYETERTMLAGPQIRSELLRDVYVTLLDVDEESGLVTLRLAVNPLVSWLWTSAGIMILGAAIAGWPRSRRAAPARPSPRSDPAPVGQRA